MSRPSITLNMIVKNEAENLPRVFESNKDCFDEIVICDTGSTDDTVEIAKKHGAKVVHFDWINDFAAARNFALSHVKTDFMCWQDGDDSLKNPEAFKDYRDHAMKHHDYVLAKYNYALDDKGNPIVSFARERIVSMRWNPKWNYFLHEGIPPRPNLKMFYCSTWSIDHVRTAEDLVKDKSRNIDIFKANLGKGPLDARMQFYYGKELFENAQPIEAEQELLKAFVMDLQPHDRLNCMQYLSMSAMGQIERLKPEHCARELVRMRDYCHRGLMLDPTRAEFWAVLGDSYLREMKLMEAVPYFEAAKACPLNNMPDRPFTGPIHSNAKAYTDYPRLQLARVFFNVGQVEKAEKYINEVLESWPSPEADAIAKDIRIAKPLVTLGGPRKKVEDIVFTCPPQTAYTFDEELYKTKGMGGSETALIEVAKWIKKLTGRPVKVFNMRDNHLVSESGVEYFSTNTLNEYMKTYEPTLHIAWRHNIKITNAKTIAWCHDLTMPGAEFGYNFDQIMCLTPFHKNYVASTQGVPREKIILTRNGIDPEKLKIPMPKKDENKIVWMSSPDRGLDRSMKVLDIVRKKYPDLKLHVYYGLENLYKYGLAHHADHLKKMMAERPWVVYHGFTEQKEMYKQVADAVIWLHPCDFIETSCITAMEMLALKIFPVTRKLGGLQDTLKEAEAHGMAMLLDHDCVTPKEFEDYATAFSTAYETKAWEGIDFDIEKVSWSGVAQDWIKMFNL